MSTSQKIATNQAPIAPSTEELSRPACAKYEADCNAFWLKKKSGKSIASGGFGIVLQKTWKKNDIDELDDKTKKEKDLADGSTTSEEYLRIEEALFLFERGILDVLDENNVKMEAHKLYSLLNDPGCGISLQVYLAYAHLRQQSFRVVRHSTERRRILLEMTKLYPKRKKRKHRKKDNSKADSSNGAHENGNGEHSNDSDTKEDKVQPASHANSDNKLNNDNGGGKPQATPADNTLGDNADETDATERHFESLKRELRSASAAVQLPTLDSSSEPTALLAWDVYPPDESFGRSAPGLPKFSVLVTSYSHGTVPFSDICQCIQDNYPVPIKIATVSDGGIVVLFGVADDGIPAISAKPAAAADK